MRALIIILALIATAGCSMGKMKVNRAADGSVTFEGKAVDVYAFLALEAQKKEAEKEREHERLLAERRAQHEQALLAALGSQHLSEEGERSIAMALNTRWAVQGAADAVSASEASEVAKAEGEGYNYFQYKRDARLSAIQLIDMITGRALQAGQLYVNATRDYGGRSGKKEITQNITFGDGNVLSNSTNSDLAGLGEEGAAPTQDAAGGSRSICVGCIGTGQGFTDSWLASDSEDFYVAHGTGAVTGRGEKWINVAPGQNSSILDPGGTVNAPIITVDDSGDGAGNEAGIIP